MPCQMSLRSLPQQVAAVVALGVFALFVGGCGSSDGVNCTQDIEPGLVVTIVDAQTRAPAAQGAVGTVQEGTYTSALSAYGSDANGTLLSLAGAYERAGTYTVSIQKSGYQTWEMKNVRVTKNVCHVNRVALEADLQPAK